MWKLGLWPCNSFSGNICFEFSVLVLCSVVMTASFLQQSSKSSSWWRGCCSSLFSGLFLSCGRVLVHPQNVQLLNVQLQKSSYRTSSYKKSNYRTSSYKKSSYRTSSYKKSSYRTSRLPNVQWRSQGRATTCGCIAEMLFFHQLLILCESYGSVQIVNCILP
jgi:hypothetical protein